MAKSSNPVDAHRKAQRKQELKRNKQKREHTREISTVKKDTRRAYTRHPCRCTCSRSIANV